MSTLPDPSLADVDGIPTYWGELPGPVTAALMFRVGRADETFLTSGITHLVEHIVSTAIGEQDYEHNAFVDDTRTVFHATGTPEEIARYLQAIAASLASPGLERLEVERDILRSERDQRSRLLGDALRWYRFGPSGFGLGHDELGLDWLGADEIRSWIAERFTRGSAVLMMTGRPPSLRLELPAGPAHPVPRPAPMSWLRLPAQAPGPPGDVGLSVVGERNSELNIAGYVAERRLRQRLRFERGLVYDVQADYAVLTADEAETVIAVDAGEGRAPEVRDAILAVFRDLASDGPTPDELSYDLDQFDRQLADPAAAFGWLDVAAYDHLLGRPGSLPSEVRRRRAGATPESVAGTVARSLPSAIVLAPEDVPPPEGFSAYPGWSADSVAGREFRPPGFWLPGRGPKERLIVGDEGVTLRASESELLTVRYSECLAVEHPSDERRLLWGSDGIRVMIDAAEWRDGKEALALVDARLPSSIVICDEHGRAAPPRGGS